MNNCLPDAALPFSHALFQLSHFLEGSRALVRRGPAVSPMSSIACRKAQPLMPSCLPIIPPRAAVHQCACVDAARQCASLYCNHYASASAESIPRVGGAGPRPSCAAAQLGMTVRRALSPGKLTTANELPGSIWTQFTGRSEVADENEREKNQGGPKAADAGTDSAGWLVRAQSGGLKHACIHCDAWSASRWQQIWILFQAQYAALQPLRSWSGCAPWARPCWSAAR